MSRLCITTAGLFTLALTVAAAAAPPDGAPSARPGLNGWPRPAQVMKDLDKDKDGFLSEEEFLASPLVKNRELGKQIFKRIDTDHDGKISLSELRAAYGMMQNRLAAERTDKPMRHAVAGPVVVPVLWQVTVRRPAKAGWADSAVAGLGPRRIRWRRRIRPDEWHGRRIWLGGWIWRWRIRRRGRIRRWRIRRPGRIRWRRIRPNGWNGARRTRTQWASVLWGRPRR